MNRIFVPTAGPSDWRRLLADPARQWVKGRSALELAVAWETARRSLRGLPDDVAALLDSNAAFRGSSLVLGIPEHQVTLEGGGHASQTDLWALLRTSDGTASVAIEAKAGEGFDKSVAEWLDGAAVNSGKPARLNQLQRVLGLTAAPPPETKYQLLHRAASAILEAKRFNSHRALLLIQSFASDDTSVSAFGRFGEIFGSSFAPGALVEGPTIDGVVLYFGWLDCRSSGVEQLDATV